jgi:hypothetical protein
MDCTSGFHQVELTDDSMPLTTLTTAFGRWCCRRLPYGISSASEVYQRKILQVIGDADGTATLVDDVLIYGATQRQHDERLRVVMDRLRQHNVTLNDKSTFGVSEIQFAGHVISSKGISPSISTTCAPVSHDNTDHQRLFAGTAVDGSSVAMPT